MNTVIPQRDLRNRNAQIIEQVHAGESFVVTRNGVPVADVTPHVPTSRPPRLRPASEGSGRTGLSREETDAWLAEVRELRADMDDLQEDPWERGGRDA
jgi:prevent-host-death family protein